MCRSGPVELGGINIIMASYLRHIGAVKNRRIGACFVLWRTAMTRSFDTKLQNTRRTLLRVTLGTLGAVSFLGMSARSAKAAKVSKSVVGYQNSPKGSERCDNCRNFEPPDACAKVEGPIDPKGWCSFWVAKS
jgi:hypothetical protein